MEQLTTATLTQLPQVRALGRHAGRDPLTLFWTASGMELEFTGSELWVDFFADYEVVEPWVSVELKPSAAAAVTVSRSANVIPAAVSRSFTVTYSVAATSWALVPFQN